MKNQIKIPSIVEIKQEQDIIVIIEENSKLMIEQENNMNLI